MLQLRYHILKHISSCHVSWSITTDVMLTMAMSFYVLSAFSFSATTAPAAGLPRGSVAI